MMCLCVILLMQWMCTYMSFTISILGPCIKFDHLICDELNILETIIDTNLNDELVRIYINGDKLDD